MVIGLLCGCTADRIVSAEPEDGPSTATSGSSSDGPADSGQPDAPRPGQQDPAPDAAPEPVPFVPAGSPGTQAAYDAMIRRLEPIVPVGLRGEIPWPDLRNPDPVVAQAEIFDLWIWMAANLTETQLVEAMSAPGSPSRETVIGIFGQLDADQVFEQRNGEPYRAFDHVVITFESADLPVWLARDVPQNAVVVYYSDTSGPVDVIDQDSGELLGVEPGYPTRTWLAIMVPTDVGWQLWRDQIIDQTVPDLEVPELDPLPGEVDDQRKPEL